MDDALRVDDNFNCIGRYVEKPLRLDYLQTFVHERGRIDGHQPAHIPCWVIQGLFWSHLRKICLWSCPKRSARSGEEKPLDAFFRRSLNTLEQSGVLAVDWQNCHAFFARKPHSMFAGRHPDFLACKPNIFAFLDRALRRSSPNCTPTSPTP